jgi:hypothetical protein
MSQFAQVSSALRRVTTRLERERLEREKNQEYARRARRLNREATDAFLAASPTLSPEQQRLLEALRREGWARTSFAALGGSPESFAELTRLAEEWAAGPEVAAGRARLAELLATGAPWSSKEYVVRFRQPNAAIAPADPWLRLALSEGILDVVNSYLGMFSRLHYMDLWYTLAVGEDGPRQASMHWHRDHEDRRLVKVWLYLRDVDAGNGAMEYVRNSRRWAGPYSRRWARRDQNYPPQGDFEQEIPAADRVTCEGPAGTVYLVDTTGFHRGGRAIRADRLFATWTLTTPAAEDPRRVSLDEAAADWSAAARFAAEVKPSAGGETG